MGGKSKVAQGRNQANPIVKSTVPSFLAWEGGREERVREQPENCGSEVRRKAPSERIDCTVDLTTFILPSFPLHALGYPTNMERLPLQRHAYTGDQLQS